MPARRHRCGARAYATTRHMQRMWRRTKARHSSIGFVGRVNPKHRPVTAVTQIERLTTTGPRDYFDSLRKYKLFFRETLDCGPAGPGSLPERTLLQFLQSLTTDNHVVVEQTSAIDFPQ